MYANHRHYVLFTIAFITFVIATLGFLFLRNRIYTQAVNSADLLKVVGEMEQKQKREQDVTSAYSKLTDEQKLITGYVLSPSKAVDFIKVVEKIGADSSTELEISNLRTNEIVKTNRISDNFTHLNARIEVTGTWTNIMRALILLENIPYSVILNNVRIYVDAAPEPVVSASTTKTAAKARIWKMSVDIQVLEI